MGTTSSKMKEISEEDKEISDNSDQRFGFNGNKQSDLGIVSRNYIEAEDEILEVIFDGPMCRNVQGDIKGVYIAAGWPSWLVEAASEAIRGWLPRGISGFEKIDEIGQGTYSNVYKAYDILHGRTVALKKVKFDNVEPETVKIMAREILILRSLDHPNVIKLEGLVISDSPSSLYLVFEYMEHDLTGIASLPGVKFTDPQVKCYMHQLLSGLEYFHSRGVLHRDIKCSNLLLDNHGKLKIADFGLSTFFNNHKKFALTSRVGTLWYRPPELLLGQIHYGVEVDLWSAGCVLGELYAGKPIMPGRTEVEQLHKIFKLCGSPPDDYWRNSNLPSSAIFKPREPYQRCLAPTFKDVSATALGLLETLLSLDPEHRGTAASALQNEYFTTEPLACNPSNLPKYPPSKEADARLRERKPIGPRTIEVPRANHGEREPKNPQAHPTPYANGQSAGLMQNHPRVLKETAQGARFEKARDTKVEVSVNQMKSNAVFHSTQLLEEHDHQIEKSAQRLRHEKRRERKTQLPEKQVENHIPLSVSVFNVDDLLEEHDRQIQEATQRMLLEKKIRCKVKI